MTDQPVEAKNVLQADPALQDARPVPSPPEPEPEAGKPAGLTPDEERLLGELQAKRDTAARAAAVVQLKVEAPHTAMHFGGVSVGRDFTPVPENMVGPLMTAAADAGVTLTQEESES